MITMASPMDMTGDLANNWSFFRSQFENYEIATGVNEKTTLFSITGKECFRLSNISKW